MREAHPSFETLVAWWTGEIATDEASTVEEHLFACDACAAASEKLARLAGSLRDVIPPVISHAHRDRLVAAGARVRLTLCDADCSATAHFAPDVDLLVHALRGDLSRAESVDVEILGPDGAAAVAFSHVPFDRATGEILIACQRHYELLHAPHEHPTFRVYVTTAEGRSRVGDYLVHHIWR